MSVKQRVVVFIFVVIATGNFESSAKCSQDARNPEMLLASSCGYTIDVTRIRGAILAKVVGILAGEIRPRDAREITDIKNAISHHRKDAKRLALLEKKLRRTEEEAEGKRPVLVRLKAFIPSKSKAVGIYVTDDEFKRSVVVPFKEPPAKYAAADLALIVFSSDIQGLAVGDLVRASARSWELSPDEETVLNLLSTGVFASRLPKLAGISTKGSIKKANKSEREPSQCAPILIRDRESPLIPSAGNTQLESNAEGGITNLSNSSVRYVQVCRPRSERQATLIGGMTRQLSSMGLAAYDFGSPRIDESALAVWPAVIEFIQPNGSEFVEFSAAGSGGFGGGGGGTRGNWPDAIILSVIR